LIAKPVLKAPKLLILFILGVHTLENKISWWDAHFTNGRQGGRSCTLGQAKAMDKFKRILCHIGFYHVLAITKHKDANVMPN
jgi:hypothetical protein